MLPNSIQTQDRPATGPDNAFSLHVGALAERYRERFRRGLDAAGAKTPRPTRNAPRQAANSNGDPAMSAIEMWLAARTAYLARRREIEPLWNAVPEWVRNWHGVYAGRAERPDGSAVPVLARSEKTLNAYYDRRVREASSPQAVQRLEERRRRALAELRLTLAAEKGACRAAGLPFDRGRETEYWRGFRDQLAEARAAVESTPARTADGIVARCRHASALIDQLGADASDGDLARHVRDVVLRIAQDVADLADD